MAAVISVAPGLSFTQVMNSSINGSTTSRSGASYTGLPAPSRTHTAPGRHWPGFVARSWPTIMKCSDFSSEASILGLSRLDGPVSCRT